MSEPRVNPAGRVSIDGSIIADNLTGGDGGGIFGTVPELTNTIIARNRASGNAGGWHAAIPGPSRVTNVFIVQNGAGQDVGGVFTEVNLVLTNTTIAQNHGANCQEEAGLGSGCP